MRFHPSFTALAAGVFSFAALLPAPAHAYIRLSTAIGGDPAPANLQRVDNTAIQFYLNNQVVAGAVSSLSGKAVTVIGAHSDPQAAVRGAIATWNAVTTSSIKFLPLQPTASGINSSDYQMTVAIAADAATFSLLNGVVALTVNSYTTSSGVLNGTNVVDGSIVDSDIILNPLTQFSTDGTTTVDLQAVMTHEFGHSLGANHTNLLGATMFQATRITQRFLSVDDVSFANAVYPAATGAAALGTISGTISTTTGAVAYPLLTFIDVADDITIATLGKADGTYSLQVPPGTYVVYAEPFNSIVQPGNLYFTTTQAALVPSFQATFLGGNTPTSVSVTANNNSIANITVVSGTTTLRFLSAAFGAAGGAGDVTSFPSVTGSFPVTSGQSVDLVFYGTGLDSSVIDNNFKVYGKGVALVPGSVRPDPKLALFNGLPFMRATLKIDARQTAGVATIFITKGGNTLPLSGILNVLPPTPVFTAPGVVSAASNSVGNGSVSPGEYVSLYGTAVAPTSGPYAGIGYTNTGYVSGYLPQNLGGVSVTFDGVAAPIFFDGSGQINLQVPFEIAGQQTTKVVTSFYGSASAAVTLPVVPVHPALFTYPTATNAYAADAATGVTNTAASPAVKGVSTIIVVGTGIGLPSYAGTAYPIQTGAPAPVPPQSALNANGFTCTLGGQSVPVLFTGWYNGFTAEAEWFITIPASAPSGAVPISFTSTATGASTQSNLTIFIK